MGKIITRKRKGKSMTKKKSWRKHINASDVENFLDDQRLEERLGGSFNDREDKDIFSVDKSPDVQLKSSTISKKLKAKLPPKCFQILQPWTAVPDPISKRNKVKTKEERMCRIRKKVEALKKKSGVVKKKDIIAKNSRNLTKAIKLLAPKRGEFKVDAWENGEDTPLGDNEWLDEETNRHILKNLGKLKVRPSKTFAKNPSRVRTSGLPATEPPHPGMSYNPCLTDHQQLLKEIVEKEIKVMKEEAHLNRVTSQMFSKVTPEENYTSWMLEMSEGMNEGVKPDDKNEGDYTALNPPTSFAKKKTLKSKRKQKEAKIEAHERKKFLIEKKKVADIYKLRLLAKDIKKEEEEWAHAKEKRAKKKSVEGNRTKQLGKRKFEEHELEFNRPHELTGNLRSLKTEGSILMDRFHSFQKRNMLEVTAKQLKTHRSKVKKFFKPGHKTEEPKLAK